MYILVIYRIITYIIWPIEYLYFLYRRLINKEDKKRFQEKLGNTKIKRPSGKLLWIHAVSVGESLSIMSLLNSIMQKFPNIKILITTSTITSAAIIKQKFPISIIHQYLPIDNIKYVDKFLNHWQPNIAIWLESELWPNLVFETAKRCDLILLNARMSNNSYNRWLKFCKFIEALLNQFTLIIPQSKADVEKFQNLGASRVIYLGNIKYSALPLSFQQTEVEKLRYMIKDRKFWVTASTHPGEEEKIANLHIKLKKVYPDILTIIIPRHPERSFSIKKMLNDKNLNCVIRTNDEYFKENIDVYLVDTLGELGLFYHLTEIALIGGSLLKNGGGHNPIEAAHHNCVIIMGPYFLNFNEICLTFKEKNAIFISENEEDLLNILINLFEDKYQRNLLAINAKNLVNQMENVSDNILEHITPYLDKEL